MSRRATGGQRWMTVAAALRRCGTELGLQIDSLAIRPIVRGAQAADYLIGL